MFLCTLFWRELCAFFVFFVFVLTSIFRSHSVIIIPHFYVEENTAGNWYTFSAQPNFVYKKAILLNFFAVGVCFLFSVAFRKLLGDFIQFEETFPSETV